MRKLVLKMSVSVDGFVGGPNGEIDWLLRTMDKSAIDWIEETLWQAGVHIMGGVHFTIWYRIGLLLQIRLQPP
jgi:hypothetical protein